MRPQTRIIQVACASSYIKKAKATIALAIASSPSVRRRRFAFTALSLPAAFPTRSILPRIGPFSVVGSLADPSTFVSAESRLNSSLLRRISLTASTHPRI